MIRFVGNENELSDHRRLDEWVQTLKIWVENGLQNIYFFCHQPDNSRAAALVTYVAQQFQLINGWQCKLPTVFENPNTQTTLF